MAKRDSSLNMLIVAAILALGVGYYVPKTLSARNADAAKADTKAEVPAAVAAKQLAAAPKPLWAASAPGRVEPTGGEVRVTAQAPGRIADILVSLNDKVVAGDLMFSLDDEELAARVQATVAEAAVRKKDRDGTDAGGRQGQDRRSAEDGVASTERQLASVREELDRVLRARRNGPGTTAADVQKARDAVVKVREKLEQSRITLRKALAADSLPTPSRQDSALAAARAELSLAEAALQRTRIRAPSSGTVLQVNGRIGEIATPSPEQPLVMIGDLSALRVRSEIEERDIGKVRVGQTAIVRSDAFPGKDFEGKIASLAQALGPSRLGQRGPRKPTDVDVLEVLIDLDGQPSLLPGMRVDVFFKPDATAQPAAAATTKASAKAN
jgi:HlyD family secretion protein